MESCSRTTSSSAQTRHSQMILSPQQAVAHSTRRPSSEPGASIGANATILPGLEIGTRGDGRRGRGGHALGSPHAVVTGNPARITGLRPDIRVRRRQRRAGTSEPGKNATSASWRFTRSELPRLLRSSRATDRRGISSRRRPVYSSALVLGLRCAEPGGTRRARPPCLSPVLALRVWTSDRRCRRRPESR